MASWRTSIPGQDSSLSLTFRAQHVCHQVPGWTEYRSPEVTGTGTAAAVAEPADGPPGE